MHLVPSILARKVAGRSRTGAWPLMALLVLASCASEPTPADLETIDLIAVYQTAARSPETRTFALQGSERALRFPSGWADPVFHDRRQWMPAIAQEAVLAFTVVNVSPKRLAFDLSLRGPQKAPESQEVSAYIGEHLLTTWTLDAETQPLVVVALELPPALLTPGENRVRFAFRAVRPNPDFPTPVVSNTVFPRVAAYFGSIRLVEAENPDDPGVQGPVCAHSLPEGLLRQRGPSLMEYTFKLVRGANLEIAGSTAGEQNPVMLEFRTESAPAWKEITTVRGEFRDRFTLPVDKDEIGQLRLTVTGGECAWSTLRLNGLERQPQYTYTDRPQPEFKHLVFVVLDALRSDMLASGGDRQDLTPNLNRLADQALVFDNVTAAASYTPTSVYSYFTGENPYSNKLRPEHPLSGGPSPVIREAGFDLAAAFDSAGYRTINIAGNDYLKASFGLTISFGEEHFIWPNVAEGDTSPRTSTMDQQPVMTAIAEMAQGTGPVALYVHYLPPHVPYNPPAEYRGFLTGDSSSRLGQFPSRLTWLYQYGFADAGHPEVQEVFGQYKENARYADALFGEVYDALTRHGLLDDTLIIVTGDHGEAFLEHGKFKHVSTVFDEMIRVPLMFIHPSLPRGVVSRHVGLVDLTPTLVELFDLPCAGNRFEGRSLWPLVTGEDVAWEDRWYFTVAADDQGPHFGYRTDERKYIFSASQSHLYDLSADPGERNSIHDTDPLLTSWLRQRGLIRILEKNPVQMSPDVMGPDGMGPDGMSPDGMTPDGMGPDGMSPDGIAVDKDQLRNLKDLGYIK